MSEEGQPRQRRVRDPVTGWEGTIEEFAKGAAKRIREAASKPAVHDFRHNRWGHACTFLGDDTVSVHPDCDDHGAEYLE